MARTISNLEFLGAGPIVPFRIDSHGDIAHASGLENLRSAVRTLIGTRQGEIPWKPGFGLDLNRLRHAPNDAILEEQASFLIQEQFRRWEPRVEVVSVRTERIVDKGRLTITVDWQIAGGPTISGGIIFSESVTIET